MAHLFEQMYVDEVDFENITYEQLIELIFTEFVYEEMRQLEDCMIGNDTTDGGLFSLCKDYLESSDEAKRWSKYAEKAMSMIDYEAVWCSILEACKVLMYPQPSSTGYYKNYFESLQNMPTGVLNKMYSETERTPCIVNLLGYVMCICKLKYKSPM